MTSKPYNVLRNLLLNTMIVFLSIVFALLLAEVIIRTWFPSPDYGVGKRPALRNQLFMHDSLLGWKGSPDAYSRYISKDFQITVTHDALGYRNLVPPYIAGKKNYLLLGDSYGWGWGVEDDETATAVLNHKFENSNFYNLGIPGYGTDQEYLTLKHFLADHPSYKYEGVILLFYFNDFENISSAESYLYAKPVFKLDAEGKLKLQNVPAPKNNVPPVSITEAPPERTMLQQSHLANVLVHNVLSTLFGPKEDMEAVQPVLLSQYEKNSIILADALLREIDRICREKNMLFQVVFLMTINTDEKPIAEINALADRLLVSGIPFSFYRSRIFPRTDLWLDTHYTPYGQSLLAEHIGTIISNTGN